MVAASLLKLTASQLFKKGIKATNELGKYIYINQPKSGSTPRFRIGITDPETQKIKFYTPDAGINSSLDDAIKVRNSKLKKLGYSKKEIDFLLKGESGAGSTNKFLIAKQKTVNEAAKNFDKNNPETWTNTLDYIGTPAKGNVEFVLPTNKKTRKFILDKIKESKGTTSSVFNPNYNPDLTDFAIAKTFMGKGKKDFSRTAYAQALKKLDMDTTAPITKKLL